MINDPQTLREFYCYLPLLWAVFWCLAQLLSEKKCSNDSISSFYCTRGWEPGTIKRFFSEWARYGLRFWLLPICFTSPSLSKDADRLVYLISPRLITRIIPLFIFVLSVLPPSFTWETSSYLYYHLFMIYIFFVIINHSTRILLTWMKSLLLLVDANSNN